MNGYDRYVSSFQPKPEYTREVVYPHAGESLNALLRSHGVLVETKKRGAKILDGVEGATYRTASGGVAEVLNDRYSGAVVVVTVSPDQMPAYSKYTPPLPLWAWSMG